MPVRVDAAYSTQVAVILALGWAAMRLGANVSAPRSNVFVQLANAGWRQWRCWRRRKT